MNVDELKGAKIKLEKDIIALMKDFEVSTSVSVKNVHLDIHPTMNFSSDAGFEARVPSEISCAIDLNM